VVVLSCPLLGKLERIWRVWDAAQRCGKVKEADEGKRGRLVVDEMEEEGERRIDKGMQKLKRMFHVIHRNWLQYAVGKVFFFFAFENSS
jgi:hypothetical protein